MTRATHRRLRPCVVAAAIALAACSSSGDNTADQQGGGSQVGGDFEVEQGPATSIEGTELESDTSSTSTPQDDEHDPDHEEHDAHGSDEVTSVDGSPLTEHDWVSGEWINGLPAPQPDGSVDYDTTIDFFEDRRGVLNYPDYWLNIFLLTDPGSHSERSALTYMANSSDLDPRRAFEVYEKGKRYLTAFYSDEGRDEFDDLEANGNPPRSAGSVAFKGGGGATPDPEEYPGTVMAVVVAQLIGDNQQPMSGVRVYGVLMGPETLKVDDFVILLNG